MAKKKSSPLRQELEAWRRQSPLIPIGGMTDERFAAEMGTETFEAQVREEARPSLAESAAAAFAGNTDQQFIKHLFSPSFPADPNFKPSLDAMYKTTGDAADRDLIERYGRTRSAAEAEKLLVDWKEENDRVRAVMDNGAGVGMFLSVAAEVPTLSNWGPAVGVAKALAVNRAGSAYLAAQGASKARVLGSAVLENVVAGTGVELARQHVTGQYSLENLGLSLLADITVGGAVSAWDISKGAKYLDMNRAADGVVAHEAALIARARAKLGDNAGDDQIIAEVEALKVGDVRQIKADALTPVGEEQGVLGTRTLTRGEATVPESRVIEGAGAYPTVNTADDVGRLNRQAPDTPEFKEFFGNSKAVDQQGQPVIVYHLTKAENLEAFDKAKLGSNTGVASAKEGFFFAGDPNTVNVYANTAAATGDSPNVIPVYLSLQNPMEFDMGGSLYRKRSYASLLREAKEKGHDGAIIRNTFDGGNKDDIYVAFEPTQIKSALSNSGAYSKSDPRIQYDAPSGQAVPADQIATPTSRFATQEQLAQRELDMGKGGKYEDEWAINTAGKFNTAAEFKAQGKGVHVLGDVPREARAAVETATRLAKAFLPNHTVSLVFERIPMGNGRYANGSVVQGGRDTAMIRIDPTLAPSQVIRSTVHEIGHVIFNSQLSKAKIKDVRGLMAAWKEFAGEAMGSSIDGNKARGMRFSALNTDQFPTKEFTTKLGTDYELDFDEYLAEQFVKYMEKDLATDNKFGLSRVVVNTIKEALARVLAFFKKFNREVPEVDIRVSNFLDNILANVQQAAGETPLARGIGGVQQFAVHAQPADIVAEFQTDPDSIRFGLTNLPMDTPEARKKAQAVLALYKKASAWEQVNPMDEAWIKRADNLADNQVFNVASTGLLLLKSKNPLVRMLASELLEDASGVAGKKQATAAIRKQIAEEAIMGNVAVDIEGSYGAWSKANDGGLYDEMVHGKNRAKFNDLLAEEIEARRQTGGPVSQDPNVTAAVDSIQAAYQRSANLQRQHNTLGSGGLAPTSVGYMPHRMSPAAVFRATNEQRRILQQALTDQFITIEGWDASLADKVASAYVTRVHSNASGDFSSPIGGASSSTHVREALVSMQLPEAVIEKHMAAFNKGAANFTKKRTELDLNRVYQTADGDFRLRDIFERDQLVLLQAQAGRVSGEVALATKGIQGKPGMELLSTAIKYGEDGKRTEIREHEAFDQIAAEFFNEPYGTAATKFMERAMQANSAVRLGGIGFNQLAEYITAIAHVGVGSMMQAVGAVPRLRAEIKSLLAGKAIDNPILGSIELVGGAEFGTQSYRVGLPFANADRLYPTYGHDTLTLTDRLLRGAGYLQTKLSFWRAVHTVQQRGMAEQVTHKIMRYIREGKDDVALQQFGINDNMRKVLRDNLDKIAVFENGNLVRLDITKLADEAVREELIQAVWRGTSQIIQGTFIGERGKWVHDGWMRMMTQFRSFPITALEKQWGRQRNSRGAAEAFGLLVGSMSLAAPIYMARVYAASVGREDQEEYLEQRLTTQAITQATLQYVALSGLSSDLVAAITDTMPDDLRKDLGITQAAGREGVDSRFVGNYALPALSLLDDAWKATQSRDAADVLRLLPGSRIPYMVPLVNGIRDAAEAAEDQE